jgi:hypothetical protein
VRIKIKIKPFPHAGPPTLPQCPPIVRQYEEGGPQNPEIRPRSTAATTPTATTCTLVHWAGPLPPLDFVVPLGLAAADADGVVGVGWDVAPELDTDAEPAADPDWDCEMV